MRNPFANPVRRTRIENLVRRSYYVMAAARRMAKDVVSGTAISEAAMKESALLAQHQRANAARAAGGRYAASAQEFFGDVVTWHHSGKKDYRPSHKRADGKNFRISDPPKSTGGLPGTLLYCECYIGPPDPSAGWVE